MNTTHTTTEPTALPATAGSSTPTAPAQEPRTTRGRSTRKSAAAPQDEILLNNTLPQNTEAQTAHPRLILPHFHNMWADEADITILLETLSDGLPLVHALALAGLDEAYLEERCRREPALHREVSRAQSAWLFGALKAIQEIAGNPDKPEWRAWAWLLDRKHPAGLSHNEEKPESQGDGPLNEGILEALQRMRATTLTTGH